MDVVVGPEGGSIGCNRVFEEFATRSLVDLHRLNVQGMRLKFRKAASCGLGGHAASLSPPPAQRWVQANFADLEGGGAIGDR